MATKGKTKSGNGAGTQMQQAQSTQQRNPARAGEHPLTRLRQEIDSLFDHFFSRWPGQGHLARCGQPPHSCCRPSRPRPRCS